MKKIRNILSLALVFIMLIGLMPMNVFAEGEHAINITESEHGSVTANPNSAAAGATVTLKVNPAEGYELDKLTVAGTTIGDITLTDKTFKMPGEDVTVTATFKITLAKAKADAKKAVGDLKNLTPEQMTAAIKAIEDAQSLQDVNEAKADAIAKDAENKKAKEDEEKKKEEEKKAAEDKKALEDAKKAAIEKLENSSLTYKEIMAAIEKVKAADTKDKVEKALNEALPSTPTPKPTPQTGNVTVTTYGRGTAYVDKPYATYTDTVTVTAKPNAGYVVSKISYYDRTTGTTRVLRNNPYRYYYGNGYYSDYYRYYNDYVNNYYNYYDNYNEYLYYKHPSYYNRYDGYYDDYDYYKYGYKYGYKYYDRYYSDYYKFYDEYLDSSYKYSSYSNYLYNERYSHYRKYDGYKFYDYGYYRDYSYTVQESFTMPSDAVDVYVEFTDWTYYGYYYDDYYYYRSRRDKEAEEAKAKKEAAKKEEEEAKAKAEAEKLPQVYENKAVIAIGSNVLDKVSKNVHTVHQMDTPAYVKNGRVMLPLRYVAEALGLQVSWVPETKTVIIWDLTQRVEIPVKSNRIIVNGITYTSDVKPEIKSSRTMLPIANIARALGLIDGSDIIWDQYNKQVTLTRKVLSK